MVGIGSVNDVPRARAEYAVRRQEESQLEAELRRANQVISTLQTDGEANRTHIRTMAEMFDIIAETNPAFASMWAPRRATINPDPTPQEQANAEQAADEHGSQFFDDINLNN